MINATEQKTVFEVGGNRTIAGNITRINIREEKIEIFTIPEYSHSQEGINLEEVKGTKEYIEKYFPIAKVSTLSLDDEFLEHDPTTEKQKKFKARLIAAIKPGLSDFRAQRMDACFDEEWNICFKAGMKPAVGMSAREWYKAAKEFMPEKESRLGTTKERVAFLGLLIRYLIEERCYTVSGAWEEVCDQSKDLGHFLDSKYAKHGLEPTGRRQIGDWCDLGNIAKFTVDDETGDFSVVGGYWNCNGNDLPLTEVNSVNDPKSRYDGSTGFFVLSI